MKTALITGVTGQDGTYLAELLTGKGYRVIGTSRRPGTGNESPADASVEQRQLDLEDGAAVARLLGELAPDEIYHLAGQSSVGLSFAEPALTFRSIALSTLHVLEALRSSGAGSRLFLASSGEVFGDTGEARASETTAFRPLSPYAVAKAAAAELARVYRAAFGLFASVGFLYNHESPRRPERFVTQKIVRGACAIATGKAARLELGDISVVRDFGWAPEYVNAMWRTLQADAPDDFVIATGTSRALGRFVDDVFSALGLRFQEHVDVRRELFRKAELPALHADPRHAAEKLGWRAALGAGEVARRMVDAERSRLALVGASG